MISRKNSPIYYIIIFILAQLAWMALLGLWIYFYVSNYIIFEKVGDQLAPQIVIDNPNVLVFVGGIILIIIIAIGMSFLFRNLGIQLKLANLYDNFIANVTHELKSPLTSIQLYLQTLQSRNVSEEKQREFLMIMMKDSNRLKDLINSILEISAIEQKRAVHDFQIFEADSILRKLLNDSFEKFKLKDTQFRINGELNCKCMIDPKTFQIVIDNLIDNSIKYSKNDVQLKIDLTNDAIKIFIDFSDNGIGIPASEHKKIFNKFYRIYNNQSPSVKGTGLGLYRVREILKYHKGSITVQSEGTDKGTTFSIELPVYNDINRKFFRKLPTVEKKNILGEV